MKQMPVDEQLIIQVDFESVDLPRSFRQFRPVLFREDEMFCCVLGPSKEKGIFACGATEDEAISNWDRAFRDRLESRGEDDEVVTYIRDTISTSKKDVW